MHTLSKSWDLIVIGNGPSGLSAAIWAAKHNLRVLILSEKLNAENDYKCGKEFLQSVHPGIEQPLNLVDLLPALKLATRGTYSGIRVGDEIQPLSPMKDEIWTGYHFAPNHFITVALKIAQSLNVEVRSSARVVALSHKKGKINGVVLAQNETIEAKYVIDATGSKHVAARYLSFSEIKFSKPLACVTWNIKQQTQNLLNDNVAHFIPEKYGWSWLAAGESYTTITKMCAKKLISVPVGETVKAANMQWKIFRPVASSCLLLAGDAASTLDPASGQGMLNAVMSGIMASETVIKSLKMTALSDFYQNEYDKWYLYSYKQKVLKLSGEYKKLGICIV